MYYVEYITSVTLARARWRAHIHEYTHTCIHTYTRSHSLTHTRWHLSGVTRHVLRHDNVYFRIYVSERM